MAVSDADARAIEDQSRLLLHRAGIYGTFPTPVDEIVAAAGLEQPKESLLSTAVIDHAPAHLKRAMRKLTGPVRALLDRKALEVHLNPAVQSEGRVAFLKLHETSHHILPWQRALAYADDEGTLASSVESRFEQEANMGASNLLFQLDAFDDVSKQYKTGIASIVELGNLVGASMHATFRRYVMVNSNVAAGIVMDLSPQSMDPLGYKRYEVMTSKKWQEQFGIGFWPKVLYCEPYSFVAQAEKACRSVGPIRCELVLPNLQQEMVKLNVDVYSNRHRLFALIWKQRREVLRKRTVIVAGAA